MKVYSIKDSKKNDDGKKTTITITTEDEKVIRGILSAPREEKKTAAKKEAAKSKSSVMLLENKKPVKKAKTAPAAKKKPATKATKKTAAKPKILLLQAPAIKYIFGSKQKLEVVKKPEKKPATEEKKKLNINDYSLNKGYIEMANNNSQFDRGSGKEREYKKYVEYISNSTLSNGQKEKFISKLQKLYNELLCLDAQYVPWTVAGPARYNTKKFSGISDRISNKYKEISSFIDVINDAVKNSKRMNMSKEEKQQIEKKESNKLLKEFFTYRNSKDQFTNKTRAEWAMIDAYKAGDMQAYKMMFESLDKEYHYRRNTNFYKLYKEILDGKVTNETQKAKKEEANKVLYQCDDYLIQKMKIDAGERIFIKFITYPKPQLVYALKRRGFHWYSYGGGFITKPDKFDLEWAKNIQNQYVKYL